jgi:hypothetical protein
MLAKAFETLKRITWLIILKKKYNYAAFNKNDILKEIAKRDSHGNN